MSVRSSSLVSAFQENNIPIVLASSAEYVPYLAATIQSIIQTSTAKNCYDILVIHKEISIADQKNILGLSQDYSNISIRFVKPDNAVIDNDFNFREDAAAASESFYCVLLKDILPAYEKVICMDCDAIVLHDLADLYATDVNGYLIAATRDPDGIGNCYADASGALKRGDIMRGRAAYTLETLELSRLEDYFQSGVMLLNLEEFRKQYTTKQILEVACADYVQWGDQDTMNLLCRDKVYYLDMSWNLIVNWHDLQLGRLRHYGPREILEEYEKAREAPKIIHYAGTKPWKVFDADLFPYFWEAAIKTPYYERILERLVEAQGISGRERDEIGRQSVLEQYRDRRLGLRYMSKFLKAWWEGKRSGKIEIVGQNDDLGTFQQTEAEKQSQLLRAKPVTLGSGNDPIISVIVPCYNVQPYLNACIDSILNQTINELLEIIIVDNHSTDDTATIMQQYAQEYDNVQAFYRDENGGVSVSRNVGIRAARGKYLVFCDADDIVPQDGYEKLLRRAEETNADVVAGSTMRIYADGTYVIFNPPGETAFEKCLFFPVVWNKLIRRDFLLRHHIEFDPECQCQEDVLFVAQLMKNEPHCEIEDSAIYKHYEEREGQHLSKETSYKAVSCLFYGLNLIYYAEPLHHFYQWRTFFYNEFNYLYSVKWKSLINLEDLKQGFVLLKRLIKVGMISAVYDPNDEKDRFELSNILHMDPVIFMGMSFNEYVLFCSMQAVIPQKRIIEVKQVSLAEERARMLSSFSQGETGFRYIWKYFKAWLHFKLRRRLN